MRAVTCWGVVLGLASASWVGAAVEAADPEVSIVLLPGRYVHVEGDHDKFQAHHWMPRGYVGGLKDLSIDYVFPDGTVFSSESHALIGQNDFGADFSLKKDALGFVTFDYAEFRKYYEPTGGAYYRFKSFPSLETSKDLALDLGKFGVEAGLTLEGMPEVVLQYEREFKDGAKSRLTWTSVKEGTTTRKIGPSWQDVDEIADMFAVKTSHEIGGFHLKGEQRWELVRTETLREERSKSSTGVLSDNKVLRQDQAPEASLMTTLLEGERWFLNEKAFFASAYRFAHMDNREFETILERMEDGTPAGTHNRYNARADNDYDTHTWVGNFLATPWPWLGVGSKLKAEVIKRESNSSYPSDTESIADGTINTTEVSLNKNKATRWGEGVSLRFMGIPRTALYTELELEQARVLIREDRQSLAGQSASNANEVFSRETVTDVRRGTWTLGGRFDPWPFLDVTTHVRRRVNDNDYDDQRETTASGTALSAFTEEQNVHTNEFVTRVTLKPSRWFRSSFRYQFRDDDYSTRFEAQDEIVKTSMLSHIYTYDVTLQPLRELLTTASFSWQKAATTTPARLASSANIPRFNADVSTWLLSAEYTPQPAVSVNGSLLYSRARNFDDFTSRALPYGADFNRLDLTTGLTWSLAEDTSVKTEYALYSYLPGSAVEVGGYHAHVFWLEIGKEF